MKKVLIYWQKNWLQKAFRTWAQQHYNSIQGELNTEFQEKVNQRRDLSHAGDEASRQQAAEIQALTQSLNVATQNRD